MPQHQQNDEGQPDAISSLAKRLDGFSLAEARAALAWTSSDTALACHLRRCGFGARKVTWGQGTRLLFFPPPPAPPAREQEEGGTLARRRIESIDPAVRRRLRPTVTMASGPNVLRDPPRWRRFHLREDRARFGDTGPARPGPNWSHLAAGLLGAIVAMAIAGVHG